MRANTIAILAALGCAATPAPADDFAPPSYRGAPLSVEAEWEWAQPPSDFFFMPPDVFNIVGGNSGETLYNGFQTHAEVDFTTDWMWVPGDGDGGMTPTNPSGASMVFNVQNWVDLMPEKDLRMQVTFQGIAPTITQVLGIDGNLEYSGTLVGHVDFDANHFYEDWSIYPNPDWEQIVMYVPFGTVLDEVYLDTVSLPAPGVWALLSLAGVLSLRRCRRDR